MKAGFGWEHGPFQIWDAIGVEKGLEIMKAENSVAAPWVAEMLSSGQKSFYAVKDGASYFYDIAKKST